MEKKLVLLTFALIALVVLFSGCTSPPQDLRSQIACPNLSNAVLYGQDGQGDAWIAEKIDYSTATERLVFDPNVEWSTSTPADRGFPNLEPGKVYYMCDLGSKHISLGDQGNYEPDYVYCGDFMRPITLYKLDASGNIIKDQKTSVTIIFDSKTKKYVSTKCGTYQLLNAPY
ncbi:MAG: hypothetical protein ABID38_05265 [Candidatus Diapherotrites archaeon]